jgi:hypothetical protein
MPRLSWLIGIVRSKAGCGASPTARHVCVVSLATLAMLALPGDAAATICTDTWIGPEVGRWTNAEDWSLGTVPGALDVACIGPKATVEVYGSANGVDVLQVEGSSCSTGR